MFNFQYDPNFPLDKIRSEEFVVSPELSESIEKNNGVIFPVMVCKSDKGDFFTIIAGRRRILDSIDRYDTIPAMFTTEALSLSDIANLALVENSGTANPLNEAEHIARLFEGGTPFLEIAKKAGYNVNTIKKKYKLNQLIKPLKDKMREGLLKKEAAYLLADMPQARQEEYEAIAQDYNKQEVRGFRDSMRGNKIDGILDSLSSNISPNGQADSMPGLYLRAEDLEQALTDGETTITIQGTLYKIRLEEIV